MWLMIIFSVMYGFAKSSNGRVFYENPSIISTLNVVRIITLLYVIYNTGVSTPNIIRCVVSFFVAEFLGKGIYKVISGK